MSLRDVAKTCATSLLDPAPKPSPHYFKLFGPRHYSSIDLKNAVQKAVGKEVDLQLVERDQLAVFFGQQVPEPHVEEFVAMATAVLPGGIIEGDFEYEESTVTGEVELVDTFGKLYADMASKKE